MQFSKKRAQVVKRKINSLKKVRTGVKQFVAKSLYEQICSTFLAHLN